MMIQMQNTVTFSSSKIKTENSSTTFMKLVVPLSITTIIRNRMNYRDEFFFKHKIKSSNYTTFVDEKIDDPNLYLIMKYLQKIPQYINKKYLKCIDLAFVDLSTNTTIESYMFSLDYHNENQDKSTKLDLSAYDLAFKHFKQLHAFKATGVFDLKNVVPKIAVVLADDIPADELQHYSISKHKLPENAPETVANISTPFHTFTIKAYLEYKRIEEQNNALVALPSTSKAATPEESAVNSLEKVAELIANNKIIVNDSVAKSQTEDAPNKAMDTEIEKKKKMDKNFQQPKDTNDYLMQVEQELDFNVDDLLTRSYNHRGNASQSSSKQGTTIAKRLNEVKNIVPEDKNEIVLCEKPKGRGRPTKKQKMTATIAKRGRAGEGEDLLHSPPIKTRRTSQRERKIVKNAISNENAAINQDSEVLKNCESSQILKTGGPIFSSENIDLISSRSSPVIGQSLENFNSQQQCLNKVDSEVNENNPGKSNSQKRLPSPILPSSKFDLKANCEQVFNNKSKDVDQIIDLSDSSEAEIKLRCQCKFKEPLFNDNVIKCIKCGFSEHVACLGYQSEEEVPTPHVCYKCKPQPQEPQDPSISRLEASIQKALKCLTRLYAHSVLIGVSDQFMDSFPGHFQSKLKATLTKEGFCFNLYKDFSLVSQKRNKFFGNGEQPSST